MLKGFTCGFKPLEVLTEEQVASFWAGILDVTENVGIRFDVERPETLRVFDKNDCHVDYDSRVVRIPREVSTDCLRKVPRSFRLKARDPRNDVVIGEDQVYVQPGPGMQYVDIDTFQPREATRKEFYDAITVYDALPNLHYFHPLSPNSSFEGVPSAMALLEVLAARLRNSTKANACGTTITGDHVFAMAMAKATGTNLLWAGAAAPPLTWSNERISSFIAAAEAGFPISISSGAVWGASAPATVAGAIVSASAENLGIVVLTQLVRAGHPVHVKLFTMPQNMRSGAPFFGNITTALSNAAFHQVWRRYGIPTGDIEPAIPNSKCMDFQSGYEKGMLALASAVSGADTIWIHGTIFGELTAHPIQAILDDDISGMVGRFLEGVEVSGETLAVDLIKEVGWGADFYLNKAHTRKWWRREQFISAVSDKSTLPEWLEGGKKTTVLLAKEKMEEILATHKPSAPLTTSQEEEIERILAEARRFYKERGKL
jgi:trimethylamine--corrinoid protein Co-methyltransferase